jgi:hypothetical protein
VHYYVKTTAIKPSLITDFLTNCENYPKTTSYPNLTGNGDFSLVL